MNSILSVLNNRIVYITAIFAAFGGALSLLLKIEDMKLYYPALATLLALLTSLLVSLLIKGKRDKRAKDKLKIWAIILFALFLVCAFLHTKHIINNTITYHEFSEENRYVTGVYSDSGLAAKRKYPMLNDEQILYQKMGGADGIELYWTKASINEKVFLLIITYCGIVLFFVACITLLTEILGEHEEKKKQRELKIKVVKPVS